MKIKCLGKPRQATIPQSLATCLEVTLVWGACSDDTPSLLRLCSAAIGICTDSLAILPSYKPDKDKILSYGYKVLEKLLELGVDASLIFEDGTKLLTEMAKKLPQKKQVEESKDFLASTEEGT